MILLLLVHMLNHGNYAGMKDPSLPRALHLFHMWFFGTKGNCAHWLLLEVAYLRTGYCGVSAIRSTLLSHPGILVPLFVLTYFI